MKRATMLKLAAWALLLVGTSYPVSYTAAPAWEVLVVDEAGAPIEGMTVRLSYQNYSTESKGHELDAISDSRGRVQFAMRRARASFGRYLAYSVWSATMGVHASFGRHAYVFVFGQGREGDATTGEALTEWTGTPDEMKSRIIARLGARQRER